MTMDLKQQNIDTGITSLSLQGKTFKLTLAGTEVKLYLCGDESKVWVDGIRFSRDGTPEIQTRVAPVKFTQEHFLKVDGLIAGGYGPTSACDTVAELFGFNPESFRQQYYKRHASKKRNIKKKR